jgi:hypothetical protein
MINQQGNATCAHNAYRSSTPDILLIFQDLSNATDQEQATESSRSCKEHHIWDLR